jgi:hypothetical protein
MVAANNANLIAQKNKALPIARSLVAQDQPFLESSVERGPAWINAVQGGLAALGGTGGAGLGLKLGKKTTAPAGKEVAPTEAATTTEQPSGGGGYSFSTTGAGGQDLSGGSGGGGGGGGAKAPSILRRKNLSGISGLQSRTNIIRGAM